MPRIIEESAPEMTGSWADIKPRKDRVKIRRGYVCIDTGHRGYSYDVELSRMGTELLLLRWVSHLGEKTWMDAATIRELVEKVSAHFGWNLHGSA